jgi:hypothetical protein
MITYLINNKDFQEGTYIINQPGNYKIMEDIIFHPNPDNHFQPKKSQFIKYSPQKGYGLGFFAVIAIEAENVILDLQNHTIQCSDEFLLKQRFCAIIELASTPFIPTQGPSDFGPTIQSAKNCTIMNGTLGQVSHHGIHGNGMENIKISNLQIKDYEVAGISLNGGVSIIIEDCMLHGSSTKISALSNYSHCKFDLPFLEKIVKKDPTQVLQTNTGAKSVLAIYEKVKEEVALFEEATIYKKKYNGPFLNKSGLYDGNTYGLVLNSLGVVVNGFKPMRNEETKGNENIVCRNITIKNTISDGSQVFGLFHTNSKNEEAYGKSAFVGPVGDMLNLNAMILPNGTFNQDFVCEMQMAISKFSDSKGTANIDAYLYDEWILNNTNIFNDISMNKDDTKKRYYLVTGSDSMNHRMKGNIGFFISQGLDVRVEDVLIDGVQNTTMEKFKNGADSIGLCICGSKNITTSNVRIQNIVSNQNAHNIKII